MSSGIQAEFNRNRPRFNLSRSRASLRPLLFKRMGANRNPVHASAIIINSRYAGHNIFFLTKPSL